jgi:DNA (cytosine-5)-methyltransferase 1
MRPKLLDLFCGAGGSAVGYYRAGFDVYGIDNKAQPHYPFPFLQMDALEAMDLLLRSEGLAFSNGETLYLKDFDAYHASPPCQEYSISRNMLWVKGGEKLIPDIRQRLLNTGLPYIIENVPGAPLINPIELSGMSFGLKIIRRRLFELYGFDILLVPSPRIEINYRAAGYIPYHHGTSIKRGHLPNIWTKARLQSAMDIDWMSLKEITQAIPPAYTEYIGSWLIKVVRPNERTAQGVMI